MKKLKFYHCSKKHWKVGDIILPHIDGREYSGGRGIYVSNQPKPHFTMYDNGKNSVSKKTRLYRVLPIANKYYFGNWNDIVCPKGVIVVESLGDVARNGKSSYVCKRNITKEIDKSYYFEQNISNNKTLYLVYNNLYESYWQSKKYRPNFIKGFKKLKYAEKFFEKNSNKYTKLNLINKKNNNLLMKNY